MSRAEKSARERIRDRPDSLKKLAESDRDSAWVYQRIQENLGMADEVDE